jgi:DNA polymerase-3 subunit gamma/tau
VSLALYRKYRPGSLSEVRGQEHVTGPLRQALLNGRVHHAYLFSGPRGCGKTSSARILARSLNCEKGPTPDPCNVCDSCVALAPNGPGSLDVVEIDAASHGGVDDARDLRERAFSAPVASRYKVYIIDEAHMVSREGFNALLKLVEEPPEFLRFVFATTEPEKVIGTIRSRTHHYPFRLMPRTELTQLLADVVGQEGIAVDPTVIPLVVRAAAGSARDGLSILDQVLASAGEAGVTREGAAQLLGVTPETLLDEVVDAFAARDGAAVFATVDQVMETGHDPRRFTADVLERLRDLVVLAAVPDAGDKGLLDVPPDRLDALSRQASALGPAALSRAADLFHAGLTEMRGTTSPRLLLELLCARVLLPGAATDDAAVLSRLERLERRFDIAGTPATTPSAPTAPPSAANSAAPSSAPRSESPQRSSAPPSGETISAAAPSAPRSESPQRTYAGPEGAAWPDAAVPGGQPVAPASPASAAPEPAAEGGLDAAAVRRSWDAVLDAVNSRKRTTKALLMNAQVVGLSGRTLTLGFTTAALARTFQGSVNEEVLKESLQAVLGLDVDLKASVAGEAAPPTESAPQTPPPPPAYEGLAPGDEIEPVDPDEPEPERVAATEDTAIALLQDQLGATVLRSDES